MIAAMQASRLAVPGLIVLLAVAIGVVDWPTLVFLAGLAAAAVAAVSWLNHCFERDTAEMLRQLESILRSRTPGGSGPTPGGAPQALSGVRVGVEAHSAAPPPTPSTSVGAAVPRSAAPTEPPAPAGAERTPANSTTAPAGPPRGVS